MKLIPHSPVYNFIEVKKQMLGGTIASKPKSTCFPLLKTKEAAVANLHFEVTPVGFLHFEFCILHFAFCWLFAF